MVRCPDPAEIERRLRSAAALERIKALLDIKTGKMIPSLFNPIVGLFHDPDPHVAALAIGLFLRARRQEAAKAFPLFLEALGSEHREVRLSASRALVNWPSRKAIPSLLRLLDDPDPEIRRNGIYALGNLGRLAGDALPRMIGLLEDPDEMARRGVACFLQNLGASGRPAMAALRETRERSPDNRRIYRMAWLSIRWPLLYRIITPGWLVAGIVKEAACDIAGRIRFWMDRRRGPTGAGKGEGT